MKRIKYLLFILITMIPVVVNASIDGLPPSISANDGIIFYNDNEEYVAYTANDINQVTLNLDTFSSYSVQGSNTFIINDNITIYNIILTSTDIEGETNNIIVPFKIVKKDKNEQSIILNNLEVVGYDIKYKSTLNDYKVYVPHNIDSVYINAVVTGNVTEVDGAGVVKLDDKKTVASISVTNPGLGNSTYKITIIKKNYVLRAIVIAIIVFAIIIGILVFLFKKYQDKISSVNPDILKRDAKDLDIDSIVKANEEKKPKQEDNVSNESLTPGVLTPRTMIPEDKTK